MAEASTTPTSIDGVTSLYRRFRPGRFVELRGQDHVVRALQGAVKNQRVSHAYLFSGPRGTGKTTTARILAKALNCENPLDGDACNVCASCVAITKGTSLDVTELDAASNNGVDDIRDITAGAWHGTPGSWKVYIFDEVHQLSKAASAALNPAACSTSCNNEFSVSPLKSRNSRCWVRDRIVGITLCGSVVASTKTTWDGGSSSVFNSAADAALESWWTSSKM